MDSIYYVLIILGISFGLIVLYIVLRGMNIIGEIPILSDIIDPILNAPFIRVATYKWYKHGTGSKGFGRKGDSEYAIRKNSKDVVLKPNQWLTNEQLKFIENKGFSKNKINENNLTYYHLDAGHEPNPDFYLKDDSKLKKDIVQNMKQKNSITAIRITTKDDDSFYAERAITMINKDNKISIHYQYQDEEFRNTNENKIKSYSNPDQAMKSVENFAIGHDWKF